MTAAYDPHKDPAADGYVDLSKQAWKAGASGLDAANAAPLAPDAARSRVKKWLWCIGLVSAFILAVALYGKYQAHKAVVAEITKPAVVAPAAETLAKPGIFKPKAKPRAKPKPPETTIKNVATEAINTPAMPSFEAKKEAAPEPAITDFDKRVLNFETRVLNLESKL